MQFVFESVIWILQLCSNSSTFDKIVLLYRRFDIHTQTLTYRVITVIPPIVARLNLILWVAYMHKVQITKNNQFPDF